MFRHSATEPWKEQRPAQTQHPPESAKMSGEFIEHSAHSRAPDDIRQPEEDSNSSEKQEGQE
jgi:hypothetical protein